MSGTISDRERFPELFVEGTIDRRKYKRVVPMKVLACGMFRTGTKCEWIFELKSGPLRRMNTAYEIPYLSYACSSEGARIR